MAASALLKNTVSIEEWIAAATFVKQRNAAAWKKLFPETKRSNLQGKTFFMSNYFGPHPFLMNFYLTKICVHLPVIAVVRYFSVYKLIRWDPANFYVFKVNSQNIRKRHEIRSKFTINTIESYSGVFTVKCFYCWLWTGELLSRSSFSCKYYYPKFKDEQMLHVILFKIAAYIPNS